MRLLSPFVLVFQLQPDFPVMGVIASGFVRCLSSQTPRFIGRPPPAIALRSAAYVNFQPFAVLRFVHASGSKRINGSYTPEESLIYNENLTYSDGKCAFLLTPK